MREDERKDSAAVLVSVKEETLPLRICPKDEDGAEEACPEGLARSPSEVPSSELGFSPDFPHDYKTAEVLAGEAHQHNIIKPKREDQDWDSAPADRPKKEYICQQCGRTFFQHRALKRHLVIHSGKRPFKCFICGRGFTQDGNLKTHMKVHKGELHNWALHKNTKEDKDAPLTAYICGECGMDCPDLQQLKEHRQTHKKPFSCPDCGKTFKLEGSIEIHRRLHSTDSPFRCSECGKPCSTAQNLKSHQTLHSREKNFHCDFCGKSFLLRSYLSVHLKTHTGERSHLCTVCGKSFVRRDTLKNHLRIHTGEKPYSCMICGKTFRFQAPCRKHEKGHDKKPKAPTRPLGRPKSAFDGGKR